MSSKEQQSPEYALNEIKNKISDLFGNPSNLIFIVFIIFIFFIFYYIFVNLNKRNYNCSVLNNDKNLYTVENTPTTNEYIDSPLKDFHIKTAYNACCTGNLKNDYVDLCALKHCSKYGVRALDFQIFSKNSEPIISASSLNAESKSNFKYKELYNYLKFSDTMSEVKRNFKDSLISRNSTDPLFLIFRLYTDKISIMDKMAEVLVNVFNNSLYTDTNVIDELKLSSAKEKVFIIVETTNIINSNFNNTKLSKICSLKLGSSSRTNQIYRESDILDTINQVEINDTDSGGIYYFNNYLNILYPNLNGNAYNYDAITSGVKLGIQFIGMNYQINDEYLRQFEVVFKKNETDNTSYGLVLKSSVNVL